MKLTSTLPFITIVLPALNEERYLENCVRSLLDDPYPRDRLELFIVDGGSTDRTLEIAARLSREFPFLRTLHNAKKLQGPGMNMAVRAADPRSEYILRFDVHAEYRPGFISTAIEVATTRQSSLTVYGDAPVSRTPFQAAVAFAQNTPAGVGASLYRLGRRSCWVDHGKHGVFRRDDYEEVGGYDETFSHNEDSELSLRLRAAGKRIWLDEKLTVAYYPRSTPAALMRQYFLYGRGRAQTVLKHRLIPRPRQIAPVLLIGVEAAFLLLSLFVDGRFGLFFLTYVAALAAVAAYGTVRNRDPFAILSGAALAIMHHAWGIGFLARLGSELRRLQPISTAARISR